MVVVDAGQQADVQVEPPLARERFEEVAYQVARQAAHVGIADVRVYHGVSPAAEVHRRERERFVQRHDTVGCAGYAAAVADRLRKRAPQDDARVLH